MSKTVELKVARRVLGFEGRAKAAEENAARLYEQVKSMRAEIDAMTERTGAEFKALRDLVESVSATVAQFDQAARGRMDSIMANVEGLRERITTAETLFIAKAEPLPGFADQPSEPAAS